MATSSKKEAKLASSVLRRRNSSKTARSPGASCVRLAGAAAAPQPRRPGQSTTSAQCDLARDAFLKENAECIAECCFAR